MGVLVAWRLRDMWPKLSKFLSEMGIVSRLETREEAEWSCAQYDTDIEGRNHPVSTWPFSRACMLLKRVLSHTLSDNVLECVLFLSLAIPVNCTEAAAA